MESISQLNFPDKLEIHLLEEDTSNPIPKIAITLTLYAKKKDNYDFGPPLSDQNGIIIVAKDWVRKSIKETRDFFIMDYASNLEDCFPVIYIKILDSAEIQRAISAMKLYGIENGGLGVENTVLDLENVANGEYTPKGVPLDLSGPYEEIRSITIKLKKDLR